MRPDAKNKLRGYGYLGITIALYLGAPFLTKEMYSNQSMHYNKPFFIAYFSSSLYLIYSLPLLLSHLLRRPSPALLSQPPERKSNQESCTTQGQITSGGTLGLAIILGSLNVLHTYLFNVGVAKTSVVSTVIIQDTSGAFIFLFCMLLLGWTFSWMRLLAVVVSVLGVILIAFADSSGQQHGSQIMGDLICVLSTIVYALFLTIMKKYIVHEDSINWNVYFTFTGMTTVVLWFPVLIFLHLFNIETFELPNHPAFLCLLAEGFLGYVLPDYTLSLSTIVLDPLVVDIAQGILGPLSMVFDYYYEGKTFGCLYLSGYSLTVISFFIIIIHNLCLASPHLAAKSEDLLLALKERDSTSSSSESLCLNP